MGKWMTAKGTALNLAVINLLDKQNIRHSPTLHPHAKDLVVVLVAEVEVCELVVLLSVVVLLNLCTASRMLHKWKTIVTTNDMRHELVRPVRISAFKKLNWTSTEYFRCKKERWPPISCRPGGFSAT